MRARDHEPVEGHQAPGGLQLPAAVGVPASPVSRGRRAGKQGLESTAGRDPPVLAVAGLEFSEYIPVVQGY